MNAAPAPTTGPESHRRSRPRAAALALIGYAVLVVALFADAWFGGPNSLPGNGGDAGLFVWDLQWIPYALTHGMNPLLTDYILYPHGANLMWNTSILVPALLVWPVTATFGPLVAYKVLMTAAVALSSWCAYLALRRYARAPGAFIGGLLYGFSPFMMVHALGHPNLAIAVFPPLVVLLMDEVLVRQRRSPWLWGGLLGTLCAGQLLTGEEILLVTVAFAVLGTAVLALHFRAVALAHLPYVVRVMAVAAAAFTVLAAFPLWVQFFGPNQVHGLLRPLDQYSNDLMSPLVPSWMQRGPMLGSSENINGETSAYLGVPLIILLGYAGWRWRSRAEIRVAAVIGLVGMAMSFGGVIHRGYLPTRFRGPFVLVEHLPLLENLVPARFMLYTYLMAAIVVAMVLDQRGDGRPLWRRGATYATAVALLPLVPALPYPHWAWTSPAYFTSNAVQQLPPGGPVLVTPYYGVDMMTWQATAGFRFRLANGSAFTPGPTYGPGITRLGGALETIKNNPSASLSEADVDNVAADIRSGPPLTAIIVGPGPGHDREVAFFVSMLHRAPEVSGDVAVWRDPRP